MADADLECDRMSLGSLDQLTRVFIIPLDRRLVFCQIWGQCLSREDGMSLFGTLCLALISKGRPRCHYFSLLMLFYVLALNFSLQ